MSRKHFRAVAAAIREERSRVVENGGDAAPILNLQDVLAGVFADLNPRFNAGRFAAACAPEVA